jgi:ABC-type antimicrobial peptide transport system permease subunit
MALRLLPPNLGLLRDAAIDWRAIAFMVAAAAVSTIFVALWPLWRSLRPQSAGAMAASSTPRLAGRSAVIAIQVALALVLTIGGTLVVSSLIRIWQTDVGYASEDLLVVDGSSTATAPDARLAALRDLLDRIRQIPGVGAAGATHIPLLRSGSPGGEFKADTYRVTRGFFDAIAPPLVEGRFPTVEEIDTALPVVVVSRTFAAAYFPNRPAVGQSIATVNGKETFTVVGVVEDARYSAWTSTGMGGRQFYRALTDAPRFSIAVRMRPGAGATLADVLRAAREVPAVRLTRAAMADDLLAETVRPQRFRSWLFGSFSVASLAIVGVGILGLVAATAARRTREAGIRMALGATAAGVVRLLLREHLAAVAAGLASGVLFSYWAVGFVASYLYEVEPYEMRVWALAVLVIAAVAAVGVLIPAARLGRTDPVQALRFD